MLTICMANVEAGHDFQLNVKQSPILFSED